MRFSLGGLQALGLIETDLSRTADGNLSAFKAKVMGQALYLVESMMGDSDMDHTDVVDAIKESCSWSLYPHCHVKGWGAESWSWSSYSHYHVKEWGAKSILLTMNASATVFKTPAPTQSLAANMGRACEPLWPVYFLSSLLLNEYPTWAVALRNASRKEVDEPPPNVLTLQLLDQSHLINPKHEASGRQLIVG